MIASVRTSASDFSHPGLPVQAVTSSHGEFSSKINPMGASTRTTCSAAHSSRSKICTDRQGVTTTGLVDGGEELGQPSVEQPESQAAAQSYGPVALLEPADSGPCIRREVRRNGGLGAQTQLLEGAFDSVRNLGQAPVLVADVEE